MILAHSANLTRTARPGRGRALPGEQGALLEQQDRLFDTLEQLSSGALSGEGQTMPALTALFQADAAGLYAAPEPGRPMELLVANNFPASAPRQLGANLPTGQAGRVRSMSQTHILDDRSNVWRPAAQEAGWQELLVYPLPRCAARLVVAYTRQPPHLPAKLISLALRSLALAVRHWLVQNRNQILGKHNKELDHLLTAGMDYLTEGVILVDSAGNIFASNLACGKLLGYAADDIDGLPVDAVLASRSNVNQLLQRVLSGRSALEEHQITLFQRTGDPLPVRLRVAPFRMSGQALPYAATIAFSDSRKEKMGMVENNLRQKNTQLERMISILAHEIRNPLGSIKAGLDYLEPTLSQDPSVLEDLNVIQGEIRRMDRLLQDALLVSHPSELQTNPQSITDLLDGLLAGRGKLLTERGIAVRQEYQPNLPLTPIDRAQMEQVFDNLIINAIHAMPNGGYLSVAVVVTQSPADSYQRRPMLEITIGDSGPGIPPEIQERIFDPFFTTKKNGTGLGLAVARRIVKQHNGALQVQSWPGIGTIFSITLPAEEDFDE